VRCRRHATAATSQAAATDESAVSRSPPPPITRRLNAADPKVVGAQPLVNDTDQAPLIRFVLDF